jgi:hypothetical protein
VAQKQEKKASTRKKGASANDSRDFFSVPQKANEPQSVKRDFRMRLGGVPLETRAGFELISYRIRQLLRNEPNSWDEIERDEHGSFWTLFRKYHVPFLFPVFFFFVVRELFRFVKLSLFLRHVLVLFPIFLIIYVGYIFVLGMLAEETAEASGARFTPQSGMRIAMFSSLTLSVMAVGTMLPIVGLPVALLAIYWHYSQLFVGAKTLLNINENQYKVYKLSHLLVWLLLGLTGFLIISIVSFLSAKMGIASI